MSRYKMTKLRTMGPVHGFLIQTPDGRTIKDLHPQFIVRELNRLFNRINRLEQSGDALEKWLDRNTPITVRNDWKAAREAKP
jgi:tetrahydromethanopterin S-methyltransferase subunit B